MEAWLIILSSICACAVLKSVLSFIYPTKKTNNYTLPPGPISYPIIGNLFWLRKSLSDIEQILKDLKAKYGPIITLHVGSRPAIFVSNHSLAHQALVQNGAIFADRPTAAVTGKIMSSNQHNINSAYYGPTWRVLRRNLASKIVHPSRVKSFSSARKLVLDTLISKLEAKSGAGDQTVVVIEDFRYSIFSLLVLMCFGDKLEEKKIKEIEDVQHSLIFNFRRFNMLNFWPRISKILFRKRWEEFFKILNDRKEVLVPLIDARRNFIEKEERIDEGDHAVHPYVDSLLDLELPDEKRKLEDDEIISLCSEFLTGGSDTTSTALQWIMANMVKYQHIQDRLYDEINEIVKDKDEIFEDDLESMKYLKAVILEGLRRHPPGHFVLPHAVTEEIELGGYSIPKNASINFMVAEMGWDAEVWDEPMEFKPERFLNSVNAEEAFDIAGSKYIKMMPFGAGRRICPGLNLAMLHLEYFVANLVWHFKWEPADGDQVDLSEKLEFTVVMKNPLQARIFPRCR